MNTDTNLGVSRADDGPGEQGDDAEPADGFAAAIGRELDTLLAIIQMNVEVGRETGPPEMSDLFDDLMVACRRGVAISERLSRSSLAQLSQRRPIDLVDLVEEMGPIVQDLVGDDIECKLVEELGYSPIVLGDREEVENLVLRIAAEARKAMPDGGRLQMTLEDESVGHVRLAFEAFEPTSVPARNGFFSSDPIPDDSSAVASARRILEPWGAKLSTTAAPAPCVALLFLRVAHRTSRPPVVIPSDRALGSGHRRAGVESMLQRSRQLLHTSRETLARMRGACSHGSGGGEPPLPDREDRSCRDAESPSCSSTSSMPPTSTVPER